MAKKIETPSSLTKEELKTLAKAANDVFFFSTFCYVIHPVRGKTHFYLYPYQKAVLYQFVLQRFNIILKFRQAGITELISMYCLWLAMFHDNKKINIISIKDTVAKKVLRKIKYMYKNLPWYMQTPIINGRPGEYGSACITGDTLICAEERELKIGDIAPTIPNTFIDISNKDIKVLTHTGHLQRINKVFNKGLQETWEIVDGFGNILKCTPKHRLLTTKGWKRVSTIIRDNLTVVHYDNSIFNVDSKPITVPPKKEEIRPTKYPGYYVSNLGRVFTSKKKVGKGLGKSHISLDNELMEMAQIKRGHMRIKLRLGNGKKLMTGVHRLVAEAFLGDIPKGYIVDHINCNPYDNYITNLQIITLSENTKRAVKYSRGLHLAVHNHGLVDAKLVALIKEKYAEYGHYHGVAKRIHQELEPPFDHKRVSQIARGQMYQHIKPTKIRLIRKFMDNIYDMEVEFDHSYITADGYINHNSTMEFVNGSFIESIPTSPEAGRSEALTLLVIDEAAMVRWAGQIWAAALPTLSTGGSAIVNSCITGDTEIIGQNGNFRVEQVCPKQFGVQDVRFMNLYVLTHKMRWQKVLYGVNKGPLETWEITDAEGKIIKCTPAHKFLTPKGWMPVREVIETNTPVIMNNLGINEVEEPPVTTPPEREELRPIPGFEKYFISNMGYIIDKNGFKKRFMRKKNSNYYRVKLWSHGKPKNFTLSKLVAETFIGPIPEGYVVDHIDCNTDHNYVTNLQIISAQENTQRATRFSQGLKLGSQIGKGAADLEVVGYVRWLDSKGFYPDRIIRRVKRKFGKSINRVYVSRVVNNNRCNNIYLSHLKVLRKFSETIYDITVDVDQSYISTQGYVSHNTPLGMGNFYHSTWVDAMAHANEFNPLRLYWRMHPERDDRWYQTMSKNLGARRTAQEIDGDFLGSGNTVFDLTDIKAIEDCLTDYPAIIKRMNGQYRQFTKPAKDAEYFIGADVATGRSTDYSSFTCMDKTGEEHCVYKGRIPVDKYATLLGDTGRLYNWALLAPESNDVGLAVTSKLQTEGYPRLYYYQKMLKKKGKHKPEVDASPGWLTTTKNRTIIIEGLEEDVREGNIIIKDPFFVQEAYTFIYDSLGRPVAMGKHRLNTQAADEGEDDLVYADDDIFGKAICNHIRKSKTNIVVQPR